MTTDTRFASGSTNVPRANAFGASMLTFAKAVLVVTAIAGTLDIIAAHLHIWGATGRFPTTVFKGIAGGALGRERAMQGGLSIVALGVFFHFFISFAFTLLFFLLYPRLAVLRTNIYAVSTGYGLFVWTVMTYVVLPLSALPWRAPNFSNMHTYIGMVVMTVLFGLPIALGVARFYRRAPSA